MRWPPSSLLPPKPLIALLLAGAFTGLGSVPVSAQPTYDTNVLPHGAPSGADATGTVQAAPLFYNERGADGTLGTADDDYRPDKPAGSPAIDLADDTFITTATALNGQAQTETAWDAGAFESHGEALPVELAGLDATLTDDAVRLTWTTASEQNNAGFRVQRRTVPPSEGKQTTKPAPSDWTLLTFIDGHGTTAESKQYRFADTDLPFEARRLRYRLVQVDADGTTHPSEPVTVDRPATARAQLRPPTPNPARTTTTLRYALPDRTGAQARLTIYDALGRMVQQFPLTAHSGTRRALRLNVSRWPSGTYFVRLQVGSSSHLRRLTVVR